MHNTTLITLTLEHCTVTDQNSVVSDSDMESFAAMLASNTSLEHLDLGGNWFSDTGIYRLGKALEYNRGAGTGPAGPAAAGPCTNVHAEFRHDDVMLALT